MAETGYSSFNATAAKPNRVLRDIEGPSHWPDKRRNQASTRHSGSAACTA